jgi:hypothetical protein
VSTMASIHVEAAAAGTCTEPGNGCDGKPDPQNSKDGSTDNSKPANDAASGQGGSR